MRVIEVDGNYIVAMIVQASHNKPHFAGPAFVRSGSESKKASEEIFNQLIASRNSKARPLLEAKRKGERITVFHWSHGRSNKLIGASPYPDCMVVECTPQYVEFHSATSQQISADFDQITLKKNHITGQLQVDIDG